MKLYGFSGAPNPRRVEIFLKEKELSVDHETVDILKLKHKSPEFIEKNSRGQIPVLELDDGTTISETVAICRYFEEVHPEQPLFGRDPTEKARVEMWNRRVELELGTHIGIVWINGPIAGAALKGKIKQIPEAKEASEAVLKRCYERANKEFEGKQYFVGDYFSIADITGFCLIDFASKMAGVKPDDSLTHFWRWFRQVQERGDY